MNESFLIGQFIHSFSAAYLDPGQVNLIEFD